MKPGLTLDSGFPGTVSHGLSMIPTKRFTVTVSAVRHEAIGIAAFDFTAPPGRKLPPFSPGAHVIVYLPLNMERCYSLVQHSEDEASYTIVVKKEPGGRGGSAYLHDMVQPGFTLEISEPINNFPLDEAAPRSVLVAGGIGITPIYAMAQRLNAIGREWSLFYASRSPAHAALLKPLMDLDAGRVRTYYNESHGQNLDLRSIFEDCPPGTHFYCCGPSVMLDQFVAVASVAPKYVHIERFSGQSASPDMAGCEIKLARSGLTIQMLEGESILDALLRSGVAVQYSCKEGLCGACETKVVSGTPDHRDFVLDEDQRAAGKTIMVCCSGALSPSLTLDL